MKHLRLLQTEAAFEAEKANLPEPWVALTEDYGKTHFIPLPKEYEYVDLGLPSGTLWAKCNVGADTETDYGLYFQWGDTVGYEGEEAKAHSTWETCPFNNGSSSYDKSYFLSIKDVVCPNDTLASEYDGAKAHMGENWRMPTLADMSELFENATQEWVTINDIECAKFTSNVNGNVLILPCAEGYKDGEYAEHIIYYPSTHLDSYSDYEVYQGIGEYRHMLSSSDFINRRTSTPIRAVKNKN